MTSYIQRRDRVTKQLETVDECSSLSVAKEWLKGYQESDPQGHYYLSRRPCKDWITASAPKSLDK